MHERDAAAADADPGLLVDQPQSRAPGGLERGVDVVGPVGDVVHARTLALEEAAHRRLRRQRREQLHVAVANPEQNGLNALLLHGLAVLLGHAEPVAIEVDGLLEVLHGDSDVVDRAQQGAQR